MTDKTRDCGLSESDTLRSRIAAAIMQSCHGVFTDDAVDAADAVIRELGLTLDCGILRDPYCVKCGIPHPDGKCGR